MTGMVNIVRINGVRLDLLELELLFLGQIGVVFFQDQYTVGLRHSFPLQWAVTLN